MESLTVPQMQNHNEIRRKIISCDHTLVLIVKQIPISIVNY